MSEERLPDGFRPQAGTAVDGEAEGEAGSSSGRNLAGGRRRRVTSKARYTPSRVGLRPD